jgi:hypothetical protein
MPEKPEQGSAVTQNSILSTIAVNQFKVARKKIRTLVEVGNTGVGAAEETVEERHGSKQRRATLKFGHDMQSYCQNFNHGLNSSGRPLPLVVGR